MGRLFYFFAVSVSEHFVADLVFLASSFMFPTSSIILNYELSEQIEILTKLSFINQLCFRSEHVTSQIYEPPVRSRI